MNKLTIGTRIRFTRTLSDPASGDHPALLYATEGELGTIVPAQYGDAMWAKTDSWPHAFGVDPDEVEIVVDPNPI